MVSVLGLSFDHRSFVAVASPTNLERPVSEIGSRRSHMKFQPAMPRSPRSDSPSRWRPSDALVYDVPIMMWMMSLLEVKVWAVIEECQRSIYAVGLSASLSGIRSSSLAVSLWHSISLPVSLSSSRSSSAIRFSCCQSAFLSLYQSASLSASNHMHTTMYPFKALRKF